MTETIHGDFVWGLDQPQRNRDPNNEREDKKNAKYNQNPGNNKKKRENPTKTKGKKSKTKKTEKILPKPRKNNNNK